MGRFTGFIRGQGPRTVCELTRTTPQSIPDSAFTPISWTVETYDPSGFHDPAAPLRVAPPHVEDPNRTGEVWFLAIVHARWGANANGQRQIRIMRNNVDIVGQDSRTAAGTTASAATVTARVLLTPGDYLHVEAWQNSGVALGFESLSTFSVGVHR